MSFFRLNLSLTRQKTKQKVILTTGVLFGLILISRYYQHIVSQYLPMHWFLIIGMALHLFMVYWVLGFDLRIRESLFFLLPPILYASISFLLIQTIIFTPIGLLLTALLVVGYPILVSALNIINVSTIRVVPLKNAAVSSLYFIGMVISLMLGWLVLQEGRGVDQVWWWIEMILFGASFLYLAANEMHGYWLESLVFALTIGLFLVLVNLWPSLGLVVAVAITGWAFSLLGVLHHLINRDLEKVMLREYILVSIALLLIFVLF